MNNGLDDVIATETVMSDVDGAAGRLIIKGHSLDELIRTALRYEDVVWLLLSGFFDDLPNADDLRARLGRARVDFFYGLPNVEAPLLRLPMTEAMRAAMAELEDGDDLATALRLIAAPSVFIPALSRMKRGEAAVAPYPTPGDRKSVV